MSSLQAVRPSTTSSVNRLPLTEQMPDKAGFYQEYLTKKLCIHKQTTQKRWTTSL